MEIHFTTKITKDTKVFDHENPNFVLFVSFVVNGMIWSWVAE